MPCINHDPARGKRLCSLTPKYAFAESISLHSSALYAYEPDVNWKSSRIKCVVLSILIRAPVVIEARRPWGRWLLFCRPECIAARSCELGLLILQAGQGPEGIGNPIGILAVILPTQAVDSAGYPIATRGQRPKPLIRCGKLCIPPVIACCPAPDDQLLTMTTILTGRAPHPIAPASERPMRLVCAQCRPGQVQRKYLPRHKGRMWQPSIPRPPQSRAGVRVKRSSCRSATPVGRDTQMKIFF